MGPISYSVVAVVAIFGCIFGIKHSWEFSKGKKTVFTAGKACGEGLPAIGYCIVGILFVSIAAHADWQRIPIVTACMVTVVYLFALLVYASHAPSCSKQHGKVLLCFHGIRLAAFIVPLGISAVLKWA